MPFEAVKFYTKSNKLPEAVISYETPVGRNGKPKADAKPRLMITIPTVICGTSTAATFVLLVGTGPNAGKLRIAGAAKPAAKDAPTPIEPTHLAHVFKFNFGQVPALGDEEFESQRCTVRKISDDEFEIDVPESWFDLEKDA